MLDDYSELLTYMDVQGYSHVLGYDFYLDIFPDCENAGEMHTDYSHPNAVYLYYDPAKGKLASSSDVEGYIGRRLYVSTLKRIR